MNINPQELRDYLLSRMPEDLASELETSLFAGDELLHQLQEEQDLLCEDYVYGRLNPEDERLFEIRCRQSPLLAEQVSAFRVFLTALRRENKAVLPSRQPYLLRILMFLSPALAAMLCVTSFLYVREHQRRLEVTSQLRNLTKNVASVPQGNAINPTAVVAFLSANVPRDTSAPRLITIPSNADSLELQVELRPVAGSGSDWDAELWQGNELVWKSSHLQPRHAGQESWLALLLDPKSIRAGDYTIRVYPASDPRRIQDRFFRVNN